MINKLKNITVPSVLMLMGRHCVHCGPMMQILTGYLKEGRIAELRIVNIEENPRLAEELGVRSVPWLQAGPFELAGARSRQELLGWLEHAASFTGIDEYLREILSEGNLKAAANLLQQYPEALRHVVAIVADPEAKINVRLGAGVIIEDMAGTDEFRPCIPLLIEYLSSEDPRIRGDACHYLSLTGDVAHASDIGKLLDDDSEEVREIARESLDELRRIESRQ